MERFEMIEDEPKVSETILVVEDDGGLLSLIEKKLARENFKVDSAATGRDAIAKVNGGNQTLLLLDYSLPDMTGKDIVVHLRETGYQIPFILMVGQSEGQVIAEMMKLGASVLTI